MAARLQNEIKTLQQRVNTSKLDLINEIKVCIRPFCIIFYLLYRVSQKC